MSVPHRVSSCLVACVLVATTVAGAAEPLAAPRGGPPAEAPPPADLGYALGYRIGGRILADHRALGIGIDFAAMARGLADAISGAEPTLDEPRFRRALEGFESAMQKREAEFAARMAAAAKANLATGKAYLAANAKKAGVVALPSGLQYEVLVAGKGPMPAADHVVTAHYRGTHIDGKEFDASDRSGPPVEFPLREVVPGWQEALPLMKAGSTWRIHLPPELAYGAEGMPPAIEPNEVLVFEIELISSAPARAP